MKRLIGAGMGLAMVVLVGTAAGATVAAKTGGGGCHQPRTEGAGVTVDLKNNCFLPTVLHIERGAEVRFESFDKQVHSVTGVGADAWGSYDELGHGAVVTAVFDTPGVYPYFCVFHPGMVGAISVGADDATAARDGVNPAARVSSQATTAASGQREASGVSSASIGGVVLGLVVLALIAGGVALRKRRAT